MPEVGVQVGPYEILGPLGAGGMGEVFRARDTRLRRDVALKVLPPSVAADEDRLRRFELEAQATGKLNHPNILAVYDFGTTDTGSPYLVSELLEGETLRSRLASGPIPARKAIEYALQIAHGLAAAHENGIVHRDLKPENLFVTRDGRVKILDFGLAKLLPEHPAAAVASAGRAKAQTLVLRTEPGALMGTMDYMCPEQIRGQVVDARSDLFSFGSILYEMLSASRPFSADTGVETLYAILEADPPALSQTNRAISPALERVVFHALEKNPEERFQSARDLAFHLRAISEPSGPYGIPPELPAVPHKRRRVAQVAVPVLAAVFALVAYWAGLRTDTKTIPSFHPLTFRRGTITAARFAPDGRTTFYSAAWDGRPSELFTTRPESPESRALGMPGTELFGVSTTGEMALKLDSQLYRPFTRSGTLARVALAGGAPRGLAEDVHWADWSPDGELAIVRDSKGMNELEYPIGNVLYRTGGWISHVRVSRTGDHVAFVDHPIRGDDGGVIAIVDREGHRKAEAKGWISAQGLAWSARGQEVWFTATKVGMARAVHAMSFSGDVRVVSRVPGTLTLHDIAADGRVLLTYDDYRMRVSFRGPEDESERDLSWLDWSLARHLSADGSTLLFDETGEGSGTAYSVYMRKTDGSPAVRLGDGVAMELSPDLSWALSFNRKTRDVVLLPTGPGDPRTITTKLGAIHWANWFPDGKRLLVFGSSKDEHPRLFVHDLETGEAKLITENGNATSMTAISPDGKCVAVRDFEHGLTLYPVDGGEPQRGFDLSSGHVPVRWSEDGRSLYLFERGSIPARLVELDVTTGQSSLWKEIAPLDRAGLMAVSPLLVTPDGRSYAYSYARILSNLYWVDGL